MGPDASCVIACAPPGRRRRFVFAAVVVPGGDAASSGGGGEDDADEDGGECAGVEEEDDPIIYSFSLSLGNWAVDLICHESGRCARPMQERIYPRMNLDLRRFFL